MKVIPTDNKYANIEIVEYNGERRVRRKKTKLLVERVEDLRPNPNPYEHIPKVQNRVKKNFAIPREEFEQYTPQELAYRYDCHVSTVFKRYRQLKKEQTI